MSGWRSSEQVSFIEHFKLVTESVVLVQGGDLVDFFFCHLEVVHIHVLDLILRGLGLWNDDVTSGKSPVEDNLSSGFVVLFSDSFHNFHFLEIFTCSGDTWVADWRESHRDDIHGLHECD